MKEVLQQHLYSIKINFSQTIRLSGYSVVLMFIGVSLFSFIVGDKGSFGNPLVSVLVYFSTIMIHEAVHGLFFKLFGGNPRYGVGMMYYILPYAYATSEGDPYSRRQMTYISLAPLFIICALAVFVAALFPSTAPYAAVAFVGNLAGAIGDMWLIRQIWRFRKIPGVMFVDNKNSIEVYGEQTLPKRLADSLAARDKAAGWWPRFSNAVIVTFFGLVISSMLVSLVLSFLNYQGRFTLGSEGFKLFGFDLSNGGFTLSINFLPVLCAAILVGTIIASAANSKSTKVHTTK
ncbi:DUF3267 domain-containing protein [Candidatus Saccharibacteria bacterium]|nr:MAG: DUF3267 domain-containing protein [Candidatus Saccharibacteria bacterium]